MATVKIFAVLLVLGISCVCGRATLKEKKGPSFCNGLDCPEFTVTKTTNEYEVRQYSKSVWSSTEVLGMSYDEATSEGFHRLFDYISGDNEAKEKIPMTAPVITRVIPGAGPACESNFTISFFVPFAVQANPPKPTKDDVFISMIPEHEAFVRSFPGFADESDYLKEAEALASALANSTESYHQDFYYTAGYDSPFKPFFRHNEVWFFKME